MNIKSETSPRSMTLLACVVFGILAVASPAFAQAELVVSELQDTGGVDFHPAADAVVIGPGVAVSAGGAMQLISPEGHRARFGNTQTWPAGAPIVFAKGETSDFSELEAFTAGRVGQIVKLGDDGTVENSRFASLPGETGRVTALHLDRTGHFSGALLAGTAAGNIWQVDAQGRATLIAATGLPITAIVAVPHVERYGSWAGVLLAATAAPECRMLVVSETGMVREISLPFCATDLDLVEPNADLLVAARLERAGGALLRTPANQLTSFACQIMAADAAGGLVVFDANTLSAPNRLSLAGARPSGLTFAASTNLCLPEECGDGIDNNANGDTDERCREVCGDEVDNDSDGDVDEDCAEQCGNGIDDDKDGLVDNGCQEICGDGIDNDGDGVDATCTEQCGDMVDNDGDGEKDEGCARPPALVDAGCAPAVWARNPGAWTGFEPIQLAGTVFALNNDLAPLGVRPLATLLDAPAASGSLAPATGLVRAATAALLNAGSPQVGYPLSADRVLLQVNAALESGRQERITALAAVLDALNQLGCGLRAPATAR